MRLSAPRRLRRIVAVAAGAAIGAAGYAGLASAGWVGERGDPAAPERHAAELVERPACGRSSSGERGGPPDGGLDQVLAVSVRPTALLRVDARGRVTAAWTNTGCAPRRTDDVYVERPDGSITPAGRADAAGLTSRTWVGDFREPGVFVGQAAGRPR